MVASAPVTGTAAVVASGIEVATGADVAAGTEVACVAGAAPWQAARTRENVNKRPINQTGFFTRPICDLLFILYPPNRTCKLFADLYNLTDKGSKWIFFIRKRSPDRLSKGVRQLLRCAIGFK
jgi:hypothetical protein